MILSFHAIVYILQAPRKLVVKSPMIMIKDSVRYPHFMAQCSTTNNMN